MIARTDAEAATRRLAAALGTRGVRLHAGTDGLSCLAAVLAGPEARAAYGALEQYAQACRSDGDSRGKDQRMADALMDLILRPAEHGMPPVQVLLTVSAPAATLIGANEPGQVDGDLVPAAMIRELAHTLGLLPRPDTSATATVGEAAGGEAAPTEAAPTEAAAEATAGCGRWPSCWASAASPAPRWPNAPGSRPPTPSPAPWSP